MNAPPQPERLNILSRKLIAVADALQSLKPFCDLIAPGEQQPKEDMRAREGEQHLFELYRDLVEEYSDLFNRHMRDMDEWRNAVRDLSEAATAHMGQPMPSKPTKGKIGYAAELSEEHVAQQAQNELERILSPGSI